MTHRLLAVLCIVLALVGLARAADRVTIGVCASTDDSGSHGWAVVESPDGGAALVHLPPRSSAQATGTLRVAWRFSFSPEAIAAWNDRVAIVFHPEPDAAGGTRRRVLMLTVRKAPLGNWVFEPEGRRLPALPDLPGNATLLGVVGTPVGPVALLHEAAAPQLLALHAGAWTPIRLPDGLSGSLRLLPDFAGLALADVTGSTATLWIASLPRAARQSAPVKPVWHSRQLRLPAAFAPSSDSFLSLRGEWFALTPAPATPSEPSPRVSLWSLSASTTTLAATLPAASTLVPLDSPGRLCVLFSASLPTPSGQSREQTRLLELPASATGTPLYDGPARIGGPLSTMDLRLLAVATVLSVALILFYLLRPDSLPEFSLPTGLALAAPGRRLLAGAIDLSVVLYPSALAFGVAPADLYSTQSLATRPDAVLAWLVAIGLGFVVSTLSEALTGRTLGKLLARCRVIRPQVAHEAGELRVLARRPSLPQAAGRNVVRWFLPPLAISGLLGPTRRHKGDTAVGTAVVVDLAPDAPK